MTTEQIEKSLRDRYFDEEIFKIGDIVECVADKRLMKIIDRGANYVTVTCEGDISKQWLDAIVEYTPPAKQDNIIAENVADKEEFTITESGQVEMFGYETKNFDHDLSEFILEQFQEFDDMYSKHQIIKCLDLALMESDIDRAYDLLNKVETFYSNHQMESPMVLEAVKTEFERRRVLEILASVAGTKVGSTVGRTVFDAVKALKEKYKTRAQWEVLWPFFKLAESYGIPNLLNKVPFAFHTNESELEDSIAISVMEENLDALVESLCCEDIMAESDEFSPEMIVEVLSYDTRMKMSRKMSREEALLTRKKERAMKTTGTTSVLMQRARRMAEIMLKRRMFKKNPDDMSRQEKERFEAGASKRKALVARLAQRLVSKVRQLQSARIHHQQHPAAHTHDAATKNIAHAANASGAD